MLILVINVSVLTLFELSAAFDTIDYNILIFSIYLDKIQNVKVNVRFVLINSVLLNLLCVCVFCPNE